MRARDLTAMLRAAARSSMPKADAQRFSRFLRGEEKRDRPDRVAGTPWLPPITIDRDTPPPRQRRWTGSKVVWERQGKLL